MVIRIYKSNSVDRAEINITCNGGAICHSTNNLALSFDTDEQARDAEDMLKKHNYKTKHSDCEITVFNISDYDLTLI